jgi:DNA repair protein RecN (Recombination protein N)
MLRSLSIRNHTLIESLDLELERGLSVITGETGAGKSIVLEALGLALGNRADARALRAGAERLEVSAGLDVSATPAAQAWLAERALEQGEECWLRRVVTRDGRSRAWINGQSATLQDLKALGDQLVDLHGQHEHHALLSRATQMELLDEYGGHRALTGAVAECFRAWRASREELQALAAGAREREDRLQLLRYQLEELRELDLAEGESEQLEAEQRLLANAGALGEQLEALLALCTEEPAGGLVALLRRASAMAGALAALGERARPARELLEAALINADEARRELAHLRDAVELDPARLALVDARLAAVHQLARKHRVPGAELPTLAQRLEEEAAGIEVADTRIDTLRAAVDALAADWVGAAAALSAARQAAARDIALRVATQLAFLGMDNCRFEVALHPLSPGEPAAHGAEQAEFLVATNPGATPGPLSRIASGGELSRISLAIQVITASRATTPTVIFDEVDVGIGGATADAVGSLLQTLGERIQVICVTHLPQVASRGHQHLRASKQSGGDGTRARLEPLDGEARIAELARMLGGRTVTAKTRAHAREMLEGAGAAPG